MKYCTKCGKELFDEAVMCTGCGSMVAPLPQEETKPAPVKTDKKSNIVSVFNFISVILIAFGVFHLFLALICARVDTDLHFSSDYSYYYLNSYFDPDYDLMASSFALGIIAAGFSLSSLIITSVKRLKLNYILTAIAELVIAALLVIATGPSL